MVSRREFLGSVAGAAVLASVPLGSVSGGGLTLAMMDEAMTLAGGGSAPFTLIEYALRHDDAHSRVLIESFCAPSDILRDIPFLEMPA